MAPFKALPHDRSFRNISALTAVGFGMDKFKFKQGSEFPKELDNNDRLGHFKQRFYTNKGSIYMCGNSLGLASKDAEETLQIALENWKNEGIKIWSVNDSKYFLYSKFLAKLMAPLIGVNDDEITVTGSTTTTIHQTISTFYKPSKERYKILVDDLNFPTDRYAVDSQVRLQGYEPSEAVKVIESEDGKCLDEDKVIEAMTDDVAIVLLPTVLYRSAQVLDMKKVTDAARERNIIIGWDLCHAIGSIEIDLGSLDCDFAVWCTYKYLNGGPGSTAALYINRKHFKKLPGMAGWYGNKPETQFLLRQEFEHNQEASGWQIGSPSILSMAPVEGALKMFHEAGMSNIRTKSLRLTGYLMFLIEKKLVCFGFSIGNLREDSRRGGHVCLEHEEAYRISMALKSQGVVPDFRAPNVIRLAPIALYTSYAEVYDMVDILKGIMESDTYKEFSAKRNYVV